VFYLSSKNGMLQAPPAMATQRSELPEQGDDRWVARRFDYFPNYEHTATLQAGNHSSRVQLKLKVFLWIDETIRRIFSFGVMV